METLTQSFSLELAPGSVYQVERARGARIHVKLGQVWLTEAGRIDDRILDANTSHTVTGHGAVVIEALTVVRICVESDAGFAIASQRLLRNLWARFAHALQDRVQHIHLGEPYRAH